MMAPPPPPTPRRTLMPPPPPPPLPSLLAFLSTSPCSAQLFFQARQVTSFCIPPYFCHCYFFFVILKLHKWHTTAWHTTVQHITIQYSKYHKTFYPSTMSPFGPIFKTALSKLIRNIWIFSFRGSEKVRSISKFTAWIRLMVLLVSSGNRLRGIVATSIGIKKKFDPNRVYFQILNILLKC